MAEPKSDLEEPKAGGSTWKLWENVAALVRFARPWQSATVSILDSQGNTIPTATGKFIRGEGNVVLQLKGVGSGAGGSGTAAYYVVINGTLYTQSFVVNGEPVEVT